MTSYGRNLAIAVAETYYIPLPEPDVLITFGELAADCVGCSITFECNDGPDCTDIDTFISITIDFDNTEIVWDHWEDGYEPQEGTSTVFA